MNAAIIQARMGSTRLPGKVLKDVNGQPMLWHVVNRARHAAHVESVIVATSSLPADDQIWSFCRDRAIPCFRGSENDVLDRYYQAARDAAAEVVVRVTSDCPLIDPGVLDRVIEVFLQGGYDYVSNCLHYTFPDGLDVEVFSFRALERTWQQASSEADREHVTSFIRNSGDFRIGEVRNEHALPWQKYRWTVDEPADLDFVREVYRHLYDRNDAFGMEAVLDLLAQKPELACINNGRICNEGYYISIAREPAGRHSPCRPLVNSACLAERAAKLIPTQSQTISKSPGQFVRGVTPSFLSHGKGSHVWDVDGNEYIDCMTALGPIILGYDRPAVTEAVILQLGKGSILSLPHPLEVELAEVLVELIPCAEMVRYGKNGSDATSGAVRLARAFTGRERIACCGYHGWQDWYIGTTTRNLGVPKAVQALTHTVTYNNIQSLETLFTEHHNEFAAVIMEPVGVVEPDEGFLESVKDLTRRNGALLIFDEMVTGFRLSLGGAQEYFGVTPDLACFGKALANGFPLSAIVGRREIMELFDEIFFSFTFGGEIVSLAAAMATLDELRNKNVIFHLWEQGRKLKDGYNVLAGELGLGEITGCIGYPPHTVVTFSPVDGCDALILRSLLQQELVKRGVLFLTGFNTCFSHSDGDVHAVLCACKAALEYMKAALDSGNPRSFVEGQLVEPVFRKP